MSSIDGLFEEIPIDEAYMTIRYFDRRLQEFEAQGAEIAGSREIDMAYRDLKVEAFNYNFQFSPDELLALLNYSAQRRKRSPPVA